MKCNNSTCKYYVQHQRIFISDVIIGGFCKLNYCKLKNKQFRRSSKKRK